MPDKYVDYDEVTEYGTFFASSVSTLEPLAPPWLDVSAIKQMVLDAMHAVEAAQGTSATGESELRGDRDDTAACCEEVRDVMRRFLRYLQSLPASVVFDLEAFYPSGGTGELRNLKPADLVAVCAQVLRGFNARRNQALPGGAAWHAEVLAAHDALDDAVREKDTARNEKQTASRSLIQARKRFLHVYNQVAKPVIRGLLAHLGRGRDYRLYFLDLQVNESRPATPLGTMPARTRDTRRFGSSGFNGGSSGSSGSSSSFSFS